MGILVQEVGSTYPALWLSSTVKLYPASLMENRGGKFINSLELTDRIIWAGFPHLAQIFVDVVATIDSFLYSPIIEVRRVEVGRAGGTPVADVQPQRGCLFSSSGNKSLRAGESGDNTKFAVPAV